MQTRIGLTKYYPNIMKREKKEKQHNVDIGDQVGWYPGISVHK